MKTASYKRTRCVALVVSCEMCGRPIKSFNGRRFCPDCLRERDLEKARAKYARSVGRRLAALPPEERQRLEERRAKRRANAEARLSERACASCGGHYDVNDSGYCRFCRDDGSDLLHKFTGRKNPRTRGDFEHWTARTARKVVGGWRGQPMASGMVTKRPPAVATC